MKKILINYDYQYAPFTTAFYFEKALKKKDFVKVYRVGEIEPHEVDLILNFMPCSNFYTAPGVFSVYWEGDSHVIQGKKENLYEMVDLVIHAQPSYNYCYPSEKSLCLYHAADPDLHKPFPKIEKKYDVGFLGNDTYPLRRQYLRRIEKNFRLLKGTEKPGIPYSKKLWSARCVFNHSYLKDINMRIFEAMMMGLPLITDDVPFLGWMGKPKEHFLIYKDWRGLNRQIKWVLNNKEKALAMGRRARIHALKYHTYSRRIDQMLESIDKQKKKTNYEFARPSLKERMKKWRPANAGKPPRYNT